MTAPTSGLRPRHATALISAALAGIALLATALGGAEPIVALSVPTPLLLCALAAMFFCAEQILLNVEFRRQAHSFTLAGVPLAMAVLVAPADSLIWLRLAGAGLALVIQRISLDKLFYNLAAYSFEIAVGGAVARALLGSHSPLNLVTLGVAIGVIVTLDQVMSLLVLLLIRIHGGPLSRADVSEVLLPAFGLAVITCAFACAATLLISLGGPTGAVLVLVISVVSGLAYRGYVSTARRHQGLELIHEFVADGVGAASVDAVAAQLLVRVRALLRAGAVELAVFDEQDEDGLTCAGVGEDDVLLRSRRTLDPSDWVLRKARCSPAPMLLARDSKDIAIRSWLAERDLRDAVMVPVSTSQSSGVLLVTNRLGETATFTADDLSLLETLAGHLGVALRSAWLVQKLSYDASHDSLTGLHNRAYLTGKLDELPPRCAAAVMLLDLNGFKEVNDTLGHDAGDRLLIAVAQRLASLSAEDATVARLGGDEFAILLPNTSAQPEQVLQLAQTLSEQLGQPVQLDEARLTPRASVGVAMSAAGEPRDLLRQADTAMYAAKTAQLSAALYDAEMDRERLERLALLAELRHSLKANPEEFLVYYQPKTSVKHGRTVSVEALVRWKHPVRGMIGPDLFIPMAESTGLIEQLTPLVLDAALAQCARWRADGHRISVAVNLSARNIEEPELPARVQDALRRHGVPASSLILEITESSVMGDPSQTVPILHQLKALGVALSLDDFGTGYSSLSYLQRLPVSEVKIDRSFVVGLGGADAANSRALIASIASLGRNLGLLIVAEGIEDEQRLVELAELGVDVAQGYHISRPLPAAQIGEWFLQREKSLKPVLRLLA